MTNEEKQLLLKDLCERLPYGVIVHNEEGYDGHLNRINQTIFDIELGVNITATRRVDFQLDTCKPYLCPMSSITEKEKEEIKPLFIQVWTDGIKRLLVVRQNKMAEYLDYLYSHHFDYRGLIEKGLALKAPEGMYKTK